LQERLERLRLKGEGRQEIEAKVSRPDENYITGRKENTSD
jgi:hypothetical protein